MLAVVQYEQRLLRLQLAGDRGDKGLGCDLPQLQHLRYLLRDQVLVGERRQAHPKYAVLELLCGKPGGFNGQARLSNTAWTRKREQPRRGEQLGDLLELAHPGR